MSRVTPGGIGSFSASFSPSGTQDVNLTKVAGAAVALGQTTMSASIPVVLASNQASIPVAATLSAETTKVIGTINIAAAQTLATVTTVTTLTGTTTLTPGTSSTNLGKAEDAGHSSGDTGVMDLAVRNDAGTVLAGTNLDYIPFTTDETGALWTATNGRVSANNSTTSNLSGGAAFTGTSDEVKNYAAIQVSAFSSHVSATDGLSLQQSSDGTNWDITDTYTIPATTGKVFSVQPAARYFRLVYTNGATLTTSLRIQTVYHTEAPNPSSQRASDAYTNETDLTQQWTFNSIYNGTNWDRVRTAINALNSTGTGLQGAQIIGQFDDVSPTAISENQFGNIRMSANRNLYGTIRDAAGNERGANVNASSQLSVSVDNSPTVDTEMPAAAALSDTVANPTTPLVGAALMAYNTSTWERVRSNIGDGAASAGLLNDVPMMYNGSTYDRLRGNTTNGVQVYSGTGAAALGKAEDAVHASGDTGILMLGVANEALINISGTDGDNTPPATDRNGTVHVAQKAATATLSNVAGSATSVTLLAANAARIGAEITNDSSALLYIKFGTTASTTSYTVVLSGAASAPFSYYEVPAGYTGRIDGIWASATGNARVTEITP